MLDFTVGEYANLSAALRGCGAALSVLGSIILAWRVSEILKVLGTVLFIHEHNILELSRADGDMHFYTNSTAWIKKYQRPYLLWFGFVLIIIGGALQFFASII